jgi:hypothetical protein
MFIQRSARRALERSANILSVSEPFEPVVCNYSICREVGALLRRTRLGIGLLTGSALQDDARHHARLEKIQRDNASAELADADLYRRRSSAGSSGGED